MTRINIFTYCFQPIQRLQPNFKTGGIRNFMYTKHNWDNAKLRIFSFILQQPNFMNHTHQTNNKTRKTKTRTSTWVSPLTQSLCPCNWDNTNSGVFIFKLTPKSQAKFKSSLPQYPFLPFFNLKKVLREYFNCY